MTDWFLSLQSNKTENVEILVLNTNRLNPLIPGFWVMITADIKLKALIWQIVNYNTDLSSVNYSSFFPGAKFV